MESLRNLPFFIFFISVVTLISSNSFSSFADAKPIGGFSTEFIHRDSPSSPFFDPSVPSSQRLANSFRRSFNRVNRFRPSRSSLSAPEDETSATSADVVANQGEYLMRISIGTPPVETLAIADTGSDLIWTQCQPCSRCYRQVAPVFDPTRSSTYKAVPCDSNPCNSLSGTSCLAGNNACQYSVRYGDRSFSNGDLAIETVSLISTGGTPVSFPRTVFGCGRNNGGTFREEGSGIVGLGGGRVSLVSQIGGGQFSYCLIPLSSDSTNTSKINFGDNAVLSGNDVVATPLVPKSPETFYFLTLEAMSVGDQRLDFNGGHVSPSSSPADDYGYSGGDGNIIIDSGTTLTILPSDLYQQLVLEVRSAIGSDTVQDPNNVLDLCYENLDENRIPTITAHFKGADVVLKPVNTFIATSSSTACLAFGAAQASAIFGNVAQMNFMVGYDLDKKMVSFKPTDCSRV